MREIILIKNGELALKGLNRSKFEDALIASIKRTLRKFGGFNISKAQSTIYIEPKKEGCDLTREVKALSKVFGIAAISTACVAPKEMSEIQKCTVEYLGKKLASVSTFKVEAKRADKKFPLKSPEICNELGGYILERFPNLGVDVHNPDVTVTVEIRDFGAYIREDQIKGAGGMPSGTGGNAAILISGGIDSPVAAYMMAKRGVALTAVHFVSPPYTGERAEIKVRDLLKKVSEYSGTIKFIIVPFTEIQEAIRDNCPEELFTLIMRRFMMRISERIARNENCDALITGESLAQVASQTMKAICVTDSVVNMPVFRPLIGMDKNEIIDISQDIDTFELSTLPYEDCCTVFTPKHPKTKPRADLVEDAEKQLDCDALIERAVSGIRAEVID